MFLLLHLGDAFVFAHDLTLRIVRQTDGRKPVDEQPDAFGHAGWIFRYFGRPFAVFFLHTLPCGGRLIDVTVG
jgi:hypothetical protein